MGSSIASLACLDKYTHMCDNARLQRCWRLVRVVIIHADTAKPTNHNHTLQAVWWEAAASGLARLAMRLTTAEWARP